MSGTRHFGCVLTTHVSIATPSTYERTQFEASNGPFRGLWGALYIGENINPAQPQLGVLGPWAPL